MMLLIFYVFAAFGLAYIVGHSVISRPIRNIIAGGFIDGSGSYYPNSDPPQPTHPWRSALVDILECPACFGFWTGLFAGCARFTPFDVPDYYIVNAIVWGVFTSGTNYTLAKFTRLLD
jgi:hypothetical protein